MLTGADMVCLTADINTTINNSTATVTEANLSGYAEGVFFMVTGDCAATADLSVFKIQGSNTSGSGYVDITGSIDITPHATNNDRKMFVFAFPVTYKYYTAVITESATANWVIESMGFIGVNPEKTPSGALGVMGALPKTP